MQQFSEISTLCSPSSWKMMIKRRKSFLLFIISYWFFLEVQCLDRFNIFALNFTGEKRMFIEENLLINNKHFPLLYVICVWCEKVDKENRWFFLLVYQRQTEDITQLVIIFVGWWDYWLCFMMVFLYKTIKEGKFAAFHPHSLIFSHSRGVKAI